MAKYLENQRKRIAENARTHLRLSRQAREMGDRGRAAWYLLLVELDRQALLGPAYRSHELYGMAEDLVQRADAQLENELRGSLHGSA